MTVNAGDTIDAADVNGLTSVFPTLIGQTAFTADKTALSASTEALQETVTITPVSGARYEIRVLCRISSAVGTDTYDLKIREDSGIAGTEIQFAQIFCSTTSTVGFTVYFFGQWTAPSAAAKTFSLTAVRNGATGTGQVRAAATRPGYIQVWRVP